MALEDLTGNKYSDDLVATNPVTATDDPTEGAAHIRGVKNVFQKCFEFITGAVTATHTELNYNDITTLGTQQASKVLTADSGNKITGFTSLGIDDNATAERLQIGDNDIRIGASGADYEMSHIVNDQSVYFSGGSGAATGGNVLFFGGTHATNAGDIRLRSGTHIIAEWDESDGTLIFSTGAAGAKTEGLVLYGSEHATNADDILIKSNGLDVGIWDESVGTWKFQTASGGTKVDALKLDATATSGNTRVFIYDVDNAALQRVTVGAADSGGSGYKVLRIPN